MLFSSKARVALYDDAAEVMARDGGTSLSNVQLMQKIRSI